MRHAAGRPVKRVDEVAELLLDLLVRQAARAQHGALLVGVVDTDGAAAHLEAVHDQVVAVAAACQRVALDLVHVLVQHVGERMMLGGVLLLVLVVLEHGEVHHPQQLMASRGTFSASAMCRRRALSTALATS